MKGTDSQESDASIRRDYRTMNDLVFANLMEDILSGRLRPGEKLNLGKIAGRMGVSRTPIREALKQLVSAGLIEHESHHSPHVKKLSSEEIIELYCIRAALDGIAARLATHRLTEEEIDTLEGLCDHMESLNEVSQDDEILTDNYRFHSLIYAASGSPRVQELCLQYYRHAEQYRTLIIDLPGRYAESLVEHRDLVNAFRARNSDEADNRARRHYFNSARRIAKSMGVPIRI